MAQNKSSRRILIEKMRLKSPGIKITQKTFYRNACMANDALHRKFGGVEGFLTAMIDNEDLLDEFINLYNAVENMRFLYK